MSPREVKRKHTYPELYEWMAFFRLEDLDRKKEADQARLQTKVAQQHRGR